jgi:hypothetical protein
MTPITLEQLRDLIDGLRVTLVVEGKEIILQRDDINDLSH